MTFFEITWLPTSPFRSNSILSKSPLSRQTSWIGWLFVNQIQSLVIADFAAALFQASNKSPQCLFQYSGRFPSLLNHNLHSFLLALKSEFLCRKLIQLIQQLPGVSGRAAANWQQLREQLVSFATELPKYVSGWYWLRGAKANGWTSRQHSCRRCWLRI